MDHYGADLPGVFQAQKRPGRATVVGPVHALSDDHIAPDTIRTGADVDDIRVGIRDIDCADGAGSERVIRNGTPRRAEIRRLPHAAPCRAHVKRPRLFGVPGHSRNASATAGTDHPIVQIGRTTRRRVARPHWPGPGHVQLVRRSPIRQGPSATERPGST